MPSGPSPGAPEQGASRQLRIRKWKATNSGTLTTDEAAQLWVDAGGDKNDAPMAAAITRPESGGQVDIVNSIGATGLWQIHPGGAQYTNAWNNAKAAVAKRRASKNKWGPNPWAVCHDAKCSNLQSQADAIAAHMKHLDVGGVSVPTPGQAVDSVGNAIAAVVKPIGDFFKIVSDPATWIRIGKVLLGAIILLFVVNQLSGGAVMGSARRAARA